MLTYNLMHTSVWLQYNGISITFKYMLRVLTSGQTNVMYTLSENKDIYNKVKPNVTCKI